MKTVSLAREDNDDMDCCMPCGSSAYPYGLQLYLSEEVCEKLGLSKAMAPGTKVSLQAIGIVASSNESLCADGKDVSITVQITDLGVSKTGALSAAAAAELLYPKT